MIDLNTEDVFLLSQGPKKVNKSATRLRSYINRGWPEKAPIARLESCQLTEGTATSVEAFKRFLIAINADPNGEADEHSG